MSKKAEEDINRKDLQMRFIDEVSADNLKAKERISALKLDLEELETQKVSKMELASSKIENQTTTKV